MNTLGGPYNAEFYNTIRNGCRKSSLNVVPVVVDLIRPQSVVDVGCGDGTWLQAFLDNGVREVLGIDGDYVDASALRIPRDCFISSDLSAPANLDRSIGQFDLVVSLEVGEHLPPAAAQPFVSFLVSLGPVVLFSAAIPGQGGTNHLNEQWQDYWANLFATHGYCGVDYVRKQIWYNSAVEPWYRQNIVVYVSETYKPRTARLTSILAGGPDPVLSIVHPDYGPSVHLPSVRSVCQSLPGVISRAVKRRLARKSAPQ